MRRLLLVFLLLPLTSFVIHAQVVASFDSLSLPGTDTFYINYSNPGQDVGFDNGLMHFPCVYDTSFGGYWNTGFIYSNKKDSTTIGYTNMYSAITAKGYGGSDKYAVFQQGYGPDTYIKALGPTWYVPMGMYVTNSTYAYTAMRDGYFNAKKFGGVSGNDPDWFRLTVIGYSHGVRKPDSVSVYLADFRSANNAQDYILRNWTWVNLQPLGAVDSLRFSLSSSDTGANGMNTPAYFCLDNFTTNIPTGVGEHTSAAFAGRIYPNPARDFVKVMVADGNARTIRLLDLNGRILLEQPAASDNTLNLSALPAGTYVLQIESADGRLAQQRFIRQ